LLDFDAQLFERISGDVGGYVVVVAPVFQNNNNKLQDDEEILLPKFSSGRVGKFPELIFSTEFPLTKIWKNQFEQQCNAAALAKLGVPIVNSMKKKHLPSIEDWINKGSVIQVDYPNKTAEIVNHVIAEFHQNQSLSLVKQLISA
jgi:hypothetical protein